jgi:hypothetical protein
MPNGCTNRWSQLGIYGGYALPHMIIGQTRINDIGPCAWPVVGHDHFYFWPIHNIQDTANPFHALSPSVTYRTSANPFQTLGPSPIELRSHDIYTPFMCGLGHSNMLAQIILEISPRISWHLLNKQMYNPTGTLLAGLIDWTMSVLHLCPLFLATHSFFLCINPLFSTYVHCFWLHIHCFYT